VQVVLLLLLLLLLLSGCMGNVRVRVVWEIGRSRSGSVQVALLLLLLLVSACVGNVCVLGLAWRREGTVSSGSCFSLGGVDAVWV
jgi:hypothetical protein